MRNRFMRSILAVVAVLAFSPLLLAQTATQSGAATPDLSGVWDLVRELGAGGRFSAQKYLYLEDPPLQPWAMEIYKRNRAGVTNPRAQGNEGLDPNGFCYPSGVTRAMVQHTFEIIQVPNKLVMLFEVSNGVRQIYMDGRGHPEGYPAGWMGHSIGKWERDILVVDTVGLNGRTWMDRRGAPHSDALHVVERFRRVDHDTLEVEFRFEDPKAFTKPWGVKKTYQLMPNLEILERITCEDHLQMGKYWMHDPGK